MTANLFAGLALGTLASVGVAGAAACGPAQAPTPPTAPGISAAPPSPPPAPAPSTASDPPEDPASHEAHLIQRTLRRVEAARGIQSNKVIPGVLLERTALIARVKQHVARELPPEAIRNEGLELVLFGFLPAGFDYETAEYKLLEDQLAGYYEPADGTMYMANDLADAEASATLAHELVHALQDQRWNLEDRSKYRAGEGDLSEAVSALAEGDATSAMFDVMIAANAPASRKSAIDIPDTVFVEQIEQGMSQGPGASAPHIMRSSLAAPYIYGTLFVHQLRRHGGWNEVNRAWDNPPTTTEQMLHPEKWRTQEPAVTVPAPTFAALGPGWKIADEDSEGELGVRLAFEEWMDAATAADASEAWGGDRAVLLTNGERVATGWTLQYDRTGKTHTEHAQFAFEEVKRGLAKALGKPAVSTARFVCHERGDRGPIAVEQSMNRLVFVMGPAKITAGRWASSGDCALAGRWANEIAKDRP
jgi:hypothetical protein